MTNAAEASRMLMEDVEKHVREKVGAEPWVTVYDWGTSMLDNTTYFCGLVPESLVSQSLGTSNWDVHWGNSLPGNSKSGKTVTYHRIGRDITSEPLVIARDFHGCAPDYLEISEDFRLFHNLFHDVEARKFVRFDRDGLPEDIIIFDCEKVKVKLRPLRQYISIRDMRLAIYFEFTRHSQLTRGELGLSESYSKVVREDALTFDLYHGPNDFGGKGYKTFSRMIGKKLIKGMPKESSGIWPFEDRAHFCEFAIGTDENGESITYTCDPDELANYFGANPDAPHYLTPVFFRKEVLTRYYNQPNRFSVEDGCLRCGSLWLLRMDNNHEDHVAVYLGDLGRDLSESERNYWRSFNIVPDGTQKMSATAFRRNILAEWAGPTTADLVFKSAFGKFQRNFFEKHGWYLFKPLSDEDDHNFSALRVPLSNEQSEFDSQVLALAKILVDSINTRELDRILTSKVENERTISKLDRFLSTSGATGCEDHVLFLRRLYDLRSISAGHRKGKDFGKQAAKLGVDVGKLPEVVKSYFADATSLIEYLGATL